MTRLPLPALLLLATALVGCSTPAPAQDASPTVIRPSTTTAPTPSATPGDARRPARVTRVVDGDTVVLSGIDVGIHDARTGGRKARLIGIDTPEVFGGAECLGREASAFTKQALDGAAVLVDFDVDPVDRYGRALVYLWERNGGFFNERIVAEGFALPFTVAPNVRYADLFVRAAGEARAAGAGLWRAC